MTERKHLTIDEIEVLLKACGKTSFPLRNRLMVLFAFRHGLRVSELINTKINNLDLKRGTTYIERSKGSTSGVHSLSEREIRLVNLLLKERKADEFSRFLFLTRFNQPMSRQNFDLVLKDLSGRTGIRVSSHSLRHSCGYYLINKGVPLREVQVYLGHKNIQNTVLYTALNAEVSRGYFD